MNKQWRKIEHVDKEKVNGDDKRWDRDMSEGEWVGSK